MNAHLTLYFEALMALPRAADVPPPRGERRKQSPQGALFTSLAPFTEASARPQSGLSAPERVELAEQNAAVRQSRAFRLINQSDPRLAWLLRFAVGCSFSNACDPALPRAFPLRAATRALGERLGAPITLVALLEPLLDKGPLSRDEDGGLMLLPGLEPWLLGGEIADPALLTLGQPSALAALPAIQTAASRLGSILDPARPVVLCCSEMAVAVAMAQCISAARGRPLRARSYLGETVPPTALRCATEADGEDLLLGVKTTAGNECSPFCESTFSLQFMPGEGMLFLVLDPEGSAGHPLLGPDSTVDVVDLEPLCKSVTETLAQTIEARESQVIAVGHAHREARTLAVHQAMYPDTPMSMAPRTPAARSEHPEEDAAPHLAEAHWQIPNTTLDSLVLPAATRNALDAIARSTGTGRRAVVLLHGPPGTGKSMAARCLAGSMGRPLYRLQGGLMRGRLYGQLERRLDAVFAEAKQRNAVILIDEADEWVGRREGSAAQVGGAHILESSQMLQALEHFEGVAVLTTNRSETLDPALSRRVDAWIHVQLPGMEERMALWVLALGDAPPLRAVDLFLLTAIPLSGGEIVACVREVAVTGGSLTTPALLAAARRRSERRALTGD